MSVKELMSSEQIWRAFEDTGGLNRAAADWKRNFKSDYGAIENFLRPIQGLATSLPCPSRPECGCDHAVVEHKRNDLVSVCKCSPKRCETKTIGRNDAVIYEFNSSKFGSAVVQALKAKPEEQPVKALRSTWQIGTYSPEVGSEIPLFLTIQSSADDLRCVAEGLLAKYDQPFVLFAPTDKHWKPEHAQLLKARKAAFIPLSEVMTWNGTLSAKQSIGDIIPQIIAAVLPPAKDKCVLRKDGATWTVVLQDLTKTIRHSKGMEYIAYLLRNPGQEIPAAILRAAVVGEDGSVLLGSAGTALDQQAINAYRERIQEIDGELETADGDRKGTLLHDRELLYAEIGRATGLSGRARHQRDDFERARQSVSRAIHAALKAAKPIHPTFHQHLKNCLTIGKFLSYRPGESLVWAV